MRVVVLSRTTNSNWERERNCNCNCNCLDLIAALVPGSSTTQSTYYQQSTSTTTREKSSRVAEGASNFLNPQPDSSLETTSRPTQLLLIVNTNWQKENIFIFLTRLLYQTTGNNHRDPTQQLPLVIVVVLVETNWHKKYFSSGLPATIIVPLPTVAKTPCFVMCPSTSMVYSGVYCQVVSRSFIYYPGTNLIIGNYQY